MKNFNMRDLCKIVENADYDIDHKDASETFSLGGKKQFDNTMKGRADIKNRPTSARYGDNTMEDQKLEEFDNSGIVDRLHSMFQKAEISDDELRLGIDLSEAGKQKVAARLGIAASEVPMLIASLTTRLRDEEKHAESAYESAYSETMNEDDRFGYEKDINGNVTVRDSTSGKEVYLQGSQATDLLSQLNLDPDNEQAILGDMEPLMEAYSEEDQRRYNTLCQMISVKKRRMFSRKRVDMADRPQLAKEIAELTAERNELVKDKIVVKDEPKEIAESTEDYISEMTNDRGTFNFHWKVNGKTGTGTARYEFKGESLDIKLLSVRDLGDEPVDYSSFKDQIEKIARDFVLEDND